MRFRYHGEYPAGRQSIDAFGHTFAPGLSVDVTEPHAISKLSGNRYFSREEEMKSDQPADFANWSRDQLIEAASNAGIEVDKRWSRNRLIETLLSSK